MNGSTPVTVIIIAVILAVICCGCILAAVVFGVSINSFQNVFNNNIPSVLGEQTQVAPWVTQVPGQTQGPDETKPSQEANPTEPTPGQVVRPTLDPGAEETLNILENSEVPINNLLDLAARLEGKTNIPETVPAPSAPLTSGARQTFFVTNVDTNENFQVNATLHYISDHLYFWIEDGVNFSQGELDRLGETFESKIYPTDREFFGSEWTPGVDNDPHLYVLYARNLGSNLAGYFSSADEYSPLAHEYSNAHEMFMLNADNLTLSEEYTLGVLAHEFQHMIHWYRDRNETSWMNEGFSVLAEMLNKYDIGGFDFAYMQDPDLQLNDWPNDPNATTPHYGAGFLYLAYFLDRFGEDLTKAVVADQQNGLVSIDGILAEKNEVDPQTNQPINADDVFGDWVVTNYLLDPKVGDGRYIYHNYPQAPQANLTETIGDCPAANETRTVQQYGVDYIGIDCRGSYTIHFTGSTEVGVLPENAHSGDFAFWSNKGDESDMTLTQTFDFTQVSGPLSISYWTWYDLEKDYDYLYLEAREPNGQWQILTTPSGTADDPSGNSYGWGYNGTSSGWIQEEVDLSQFAGKQVELRFEYVTDAAVNGEGFLLDDISIPQINYQTDFEADNSGWDAAGWVRIENILPQTYRVSLILEGNTTTVQTIELSADQTADIPIQIGGDVDQAVLVVSGTSRFTRQPATYEISIDR